MKSAKTAKRARRITTILMADFGDGLLVSPFEAEQLSEVLPFQVLHHNERPALVFPGFVNRQIFGWLGVEAARASCRNLSTPMDLVDEIVG